MADNTTGKSGYRIISKLKTTTTLNTHTFHIPVMGLAFSIDSPVKVARYGISSVVSLSDDALIEQTREYYCRKNNLPYVAIEPGEEDYRARRITTYLNLMHQLIEEQVEKLRNSPFTEGTEITKYFRLLPDTSPLKMRYNQMLFAQDMEVKFQLQQELRQLVQPGTIDVNIMTKLDKTNYEKSGQALPVEYSDAMAALRGFARSKVAGSVVYSAGMNPRLYGYMEQFPDFLPTAQGQLKKQIIIKVSDYRSAAVQGKILAKKGLWVSDFRIESGLNCGGHAFATDGYLMGPILEEFKQNRQALQAELHDLYTKALAAKDISAPASPMEQRITAQGGIGTGKEHDFLLQHYGLDATGWGTPFLLVPEATAVDFDTLDKLAKAGKNDLFLSNISPLGVPFNSLRNTTSEEEKFARIAKGKPGSPCVKKHLVSSTEFTEQALCTASSKFQKRKIAQLQEQNLAPEEYAKAYAKIVEKECLCEGLAKTIFIKKDFLKKKQGSAVAICPGPNLAWFSGIYSLVEMCDHIYGRTNLLNSTYRPNMFVNELRLYISYLRNQVQNGEELTDKRLKYLLNFRDNLLRGIEYYKQLTPHWSNQTEAYREQMLQEYTEAETELQQLEIGEPVLA